MTQDEARKILDDANAKLGEFFDSAQICVTWLDENDQGTICVHRGIGNWYARRASAEEFIESNQQEDQARAIARHLDPPDKEDWKE